MAGTINPLYIKSEAEGCLLCHHAPCTKVCPYGKDPARAIRAYRFENYQGAAGIAGSDAKCSDCSEQACRNACIKSKIGRPVEIRDLMIDLGSIHNRGDNTTGSTNEQSVKAASVSRPSQKPAHTDLSIDFCGIRCENPFFLSSSVVASNYEMVARAFDMGWAGVAFKTIGTFVPEEVSPRFATISKEGSSFIGFKNIEQISDHTLEENIGFLAQLKKAYPEKIVIASILGQNEREWTYLARLMTEAGADILECNFSCPHMSGEGLGSDVGQNPELVARFTAATRLGTHLPILAKMTPNVGNMEPPAIAAMRNGATGIAAINTIKSIMNIRLDDFNSEPPVDGKSSVGGYSGKAVKPIALRFIHDMKKHPELKDAPISGMGGIETWRDAAEFLALGCANLQITTSVMQYGYRIIEDLTEGLALYLKQKGFAALQDMVGLALPNLVPADQLNRHSISYPRFDRKACIGCGRCYISCQDGGHQALLMAEGASGPQLIPERCVGCHLCQVVCPVGAISPGRRIPLKDVRKATAEQAV